MIWSFIVYSFSQILFFAIGWYINTTCFLMTNCSLIWIIINRIFFTEKLFIDYEVSNKLVSILFSTSFATSCSLFELIIFEILDILVERLILLYILCHILYIVKDGFTGNSPSSLHFSTSFSSFQYTNAIYSHPETNIHGFGNENTH